MTHDLTGIWELPTKDEALERVSETVLARPHMHPADWQTAEYDAVHLALECGATWPEVNAALGQ